MSADALTISLTGPLADEVRAAAELRGLSPEDYVRQQLEVDIANDKFAAEYDDLSWEEDVRRLEEPGEDVDADVVFAELRAKVEAARQRKP